MKCKHCGIEVFKKIINGVEVLAEIGFLPGIRGVYIDIPPKDIHVGHTCEVEGGEE